MVFNFLFEPKDICNLHKSIKTLYCSAKYWKINNNHLGLVEKFRILHVFELHPSQKRSKIEINFNHFWRLNKLFTVNNSFENFSNKLKNFTHYWIVFKRHKGFKKTNTKFSTLEFTKSWIFDLLSLLRVPLFL